MDLQEIIPYEDFMKLNPKSRRVDLLRSYRLEFPDKEIREHWNITTKQYYSLLWRYQLVKDSKMDSSDAGQLDFDVDNSEKNDPQQSRKEVTGKIIDAEYSVVSEGVNLASQQMALALANTAAAGFEDFERKAAAVQSGTYISYDIEGTPEAVQKRLNAIGTLLALEDSNLKLKIEVYRA